MFSEKSFFRNGLQMGYNTLYTQTVGARGYSRVLQTNIVYSTHVFKCSVHREQQHIQCIPQWTDYKYIIALVELSADARLKCSCQNSYLLCVHAVTERHNSDTLHCLVKLGTLNTSIAGEHCSQNNTIMTTTECKSMSVSIV